MATTLSLNGIEAVIGLLTGLLVGASSIGSGSVVTPLLLLLTRVPTGTVIGTSLALAAGTKLFGYVAHRRLGHIHHGLGAAVIAGTVPGSAVAALLVAGLGRTALPVIPARQAVGVLLVLLSGLLFLARRSSGLRAQEAAPVRIAARTTPVRGKLALVTGAAVSLVVTLTSIGSGGLLMLAFLLWRPALGFSRTTGQKAESLPLCSLVGTATFCGLVATLLGTLAHLALNNISGRLLAQLAAGSVPGVVLGARLSRKIPEHYYTAGVAGLNLLLGLRLAWAG